MNALGPAIVARACETVCAEAKRVIGEGHPYWPALSPETLARKVMNTPLLETGELRGSIEWNSSGNQGYVGSNNDKAVWQELGLLAGFARIAARSAGCTRCRVLIRLTGRMSGRTRLFLIRYKPGLTGVAGLDAFIRIVLHLLIRLHLLTGLCVPKTLSELMT